jgi:signal transduction histidine kinase
MVSIETSKLFRELPSDDLRRLKDAARERAFAPQQVIFQEGTPGDGIFIIQEGQVQICSRMGGGQPRTLTQLEPGDLFGEMAVLDDEPRSATAIAQTPVTTLFISREDLMRLAEKSPQLAVGLVRAISHRLREFNQQYIREVIGSERMALVGRFASSIVHDLRNPLSVISLSSDVMMLPGISDENRAACKTRIVKQVERINSMLSELLEFARGEPSVQSRERMIYATFVQPLMEEIRAEVSAKSISIKCDPPPESMVWINPARLARVFHNFVGNALDAMPGGGSLRLKFSVSNTEITTELQDSGPGIPPEMAGQLFQAFATYGKSSGTGLGLSICKRIIEDHHGSIFARNAPEGGALFGFTLPLDKK